MFGGYDSFIEEFYLAAKDLLVYNYNIIVFEGPGQGQSLREGLKFEPYWEKPVTAVLDHFTLENICVIGISWGGYLALRAAAFEKRISKVVAYDVLYDGFECMTNPIPKPINYLLCFLFSIKARAPINKLLSKMKQKSIILDWAVTHGQFITGTSTPYDFYVHLKKHSMKNIMDRVDCDVLLLAGANDHYIPRDHMTKLMAGLINARTLKGKIFTIAEGGAEHCQIGDHQLAIKQIFEWLSNLEK